MTAYTGFPCREPPLAVPVKFDVPAYTTSEIYVNWNCSAAPRSRSRLTGIETSAFSLRAVGYPIPHVKIADGKQVKHDLLQA